MNGFEYLAFSILGVAVLVHVVFVSITIGTGWISAMARFLGWRRQDASLEFMGRKVFKILVVHELFSGVWGTIITVILAGFFPTLTALVTDLLFYPILIALSAIFIRIPAIALFWYTWGKIRPSVHSALGFLMALTGFGVPMGFRYLFAEITYPYAVGMALEGLRDQARFAVFLNPLYPPLISHTWVAALSVGGFIAASFFAIKRNVDVKSSWTGLWHGVLFLIPQPIFGSWYLLTLSMRSPILFGNITSIAEQPTFNVLPIFGLKLTLVATLAALSFVVWRRVQHGMGTLPRYAVVLGPLAVCVVIIGEFLNDAGRYPFLVLLGNEGLAPASFMNVYIDIPISLILGIVGLLLVFVGLFTITAYYALNRRFLADLPEK